MNFRDEMDFSRRQSDRTLAPLLIQLEEVEEKIDGLQRSRLELIEKILSQESFRGSSDGNYYNILWSIFNCF
jgi:hypothetical protein